MILKYLWSLKISKEWLEDKVKMNQIKKLFWKDNLHVKKIPQIRILQKNLLLNLKIELWL